MVVKPDLDRERRCGIPEVVFGENKTLGDLLEITEKFLSSSNRVIITRIDEGKAEKVLGKYNDFKINYNQKGKILVIKKSGFKVKKNGRIGVITAGTSDVCAAEESKTVAEELGCTVISEYDVGIAGIHRVFPALEKMNKEGVSVIIAIAGMEGALPSVVAGLVDVPVIGVPTSVGYGVGKGGTAALNTMLNSCTPVAVVNIDNGYGAAVLAHQIAKRAKNG